MTDKLNVNMMIKGKDVFSYDFTIIDITESETGILFKLETSSGEKTEFLVPAPKQ